MAGLGEPMPLVTARCSEGSTGAAAASEVHVARGGIARFDNFILCRQLNKYMSLHRLGIIHLLLVHYHRENTLALLCL